ncbi:MAG: wyosine [tRNA(Phe)-imidazoG37] synthetase (radical SAM superfamily) [Gammaproteobacteria bacterium]|jgi:wyosine [tRNA(Phe)-imidazoG37] synthetase (radical SAM superfamily)
MSLNTQNHDRDQAGLTYLYPVVSRRSRGVSIGVNLNTNNACNWRCVYCQVEGLVRGAAPALNPGLLRKETNGFLDQVLNGDWMLENAPPEARRLNDVAFSGNGEATTCPQFLEAVEIVADIMDARAMSEVKLVLITNGSMLHKENVQRALTRMAKSGGEVWFKLDGGTEADRLAINSLAIPDARVRENLLQCSTLIPTRIQTCMFARDGKVPSDEQVQAYLDFLGEQVEAQVSIQDVMLYGLARPSAQTEASELGTLSDDWLKDMAVRIHALGLPVTTYGADGMLS